MTQTLAENQQETTTEIQDQVISKEVYSEAIQNHNIIEDNLGLDRNIYYALCSPTNTRLSRKSVGNNATWDFDRLLWFFEHEEEAKIMAEKYTQGRDKFLVLKLPSKIVDVLLHGSKKEKAAMRLRCEYEIKHSEFKEKDKAFDLDCEKSKMDKSIVSVDAPDTLSDADRKTHDFLKKKLDALDEKKKSLDELHAQCTKLDHEIEENKNHNNARDKEKNKPLNDDDFEIEEASVGKELISANANARRRALMYELSQDEIVKDIRKQHPNLRDQAKDIASKAVLWAKKYQPGCEVIVGGIPKKITDMKSLDSRFAQLEAPGQPCVTIHRTDAQPVSTNDFNKRLSGEVVLSGVDDKGQPKYLAANAFWTGNVNKCIYKSIVFTNKPVGNDTYNLFTGFGVKPKEGKCDKILDHIKEVICAGDETNYTALIKLLAWQMQNIGKPSRIITALKSKAQQVGKGTLLADLLTPIYGNSGFVTSDLGQIITRFNDTIRGKAFIYLDEALFSGDRKSADAVKSLATATRQGVESKNIPTVQFPIAVNLFLTTNHDDAAHVEEADARYWILEVSPKRVGDTIYFNELYAEIDGGGREAFMYHLINLDVKHFVPSRDVPKDNAFKDAMIRNSINPYDARKWLEECCRAEMILGFQRERDSKLPWEIWKKGEEYPNGIFQTAYTEWQKTVKSPVAPKTTPANKFGELLTAAGLIVRVDGQRYRKLPDHTECLVTLTKMIEKMGK